MGHVKVKILPLIFPFHLKTLHNGLLHDDWPMPEAPDSPHQQDAVPSEFEGRV